MFDVMCRDGCVVVWYAMIWYKESENSKSVRLFGWLR